MDIYGHKCCHHFLERKHPRRRGNRVPWEPDVGDLLVPQSKVEVQGFGDIKFEGLELSADTGVMVLGIGYSDPFLRVLVCRP